MIDDRAISAISYLANQIRGQWDRPGIEANVRKVAHLPLADVVMAVIRAADDVACGSPGVIARTDTSCWRERNADRKQVKPATWDPETTCGTCSKAEHICRATPEHISGHTFVRRVDAIRQATRRPETGLGATNSPRDVREDTPDNDNAPKEAA